MKNIIVILSLASYVIAGDMGLSAYGGLILYNISSNKDYSDFGMELNSKPGMNFGIQYNKLPLILSVGYSMRGVIVKHGGFDYEHLLNYIEISSLYPYTLGPGNLLGGINLGKILSAKSEHYCGKEKCDYIDLCSL